MTFDFRSRSAWTCARNRSFEFVASIRRLAPGVAKQLVEHPCENLVDALDENVTRPGS